MERYDVVVVGVGGMGSAALYHLARRGKRVLGLERFDIPHELGSSHGITRIIRLAYFEHPAYVPLLRRAYELWRELEAEAGEQLLHVTGTVEGGRADLRGLAPLLPRARPPARGARRAPKLADAFRAIGSRPTSRSLYQPDGGFLLPERCIVAHVSGALARGAVVRARERVLEWDGGENGVRVVTDRGVVEAERLVLTAGAWSQDVARLPAGLGRGCASGSRLVPAARPELFDARTASRSSTSQLDGDHFYGFPTFGIPGFKLGRYDYEGERGDPDAISREPTPEDEAPLRAIRRALLPGRRRADAGAQDLPLRAVTGRALPDRPPPGDAIEPSSAPASPGTASSSARSSARSWPTSRSTARRATTSSSCASRASMTRNRISHVDFTPRRFRPRAPHKGVWLSRDRNPRERISVLRGCGREDSNLQGAEAQRDLNPSRLPVPPRPRGPQCRATVRFALETPRRL